jgi:outer membrane protein OmpA-like peptidoglycan-associated protein
MDVPNTPTAAGVGDLRLLTKFFLFGKNGFGLAAVPQFTFPTGSATSLRGDDTFGIEPRLAADYRFNNGVFVAINLGVYIRTYNRTVDYDLVRVSDQLRYGVGAGIPLPKGFMVSAELTGATSFSKFTGGPLYTPLEWYVGARYAIKSGVELSLGGGGALVGAVGSPNVRLFAGFSYALPAKPAPPRPTEEILPRPLDDSAKPEVPTGPVVPTQGPDTDKDGVEDKLDRCPNEPGPSENGGCPDRDQDKDGVADRLDKCPKLPGPKESNGCPLLDITEASITLALPLKFVSGSTELDPASRPTVAALVTAWRATPTIKKVLIAVTASGYTHHATKKIAIRRAKLLTDLLIESGAPAELLAIRAVSEPGTDEINRVDLVREAVRPEPTRPEPARPEPIKPEPIKPEPLRTEPVKPEPAKAEPEKIAPTRHHHRSNAAPSDADSDEEDQPHHGKKSHREKGGKSKKSNKEKRNHH